MKNRCGDGDVGLEIAMWVFAIGFQCLFLGDYLTGFSTLTHDNINLNYPAFIQYFRDLSSGHLSLYNFLSRFGEPLVPVMAQMRLWDPLQTLIGLGLWNLFDDKVQVFNLVRYFVVLLQCLGAYVFFRPKMQTQFTRFVVILTLMCGSFFFGSFRQDGVLNQFLWVPWILILVRNHFLTGEAKVFHCLLLGVLIGSSFQSYFFLFTVIFVLLFVGLRMAFVEGVPWKANPAGRAWPFLCKIALVNLTCLPMAAINLTTLAESKSWKFPMRTLPLEKRLSHVFYPERLEKAEESERSSNLESIEVNKDLLIETGANSRFWDYILLFSPRSNSGVSFDSSRALGWPSEAFLYFGIFPLILGFVGIYGVKNGEGAVWLNLLCLFVLLSLGKDGFLYLALLKVFPFLGLVRNTHCLVMYIEFIFIYFITQGTDDFCARVKRWVNAR